MTEPSKREGLGEQIGGAIGSVIDGAVDLAIDSVEVVGKLVMSPLNMPGMRKRPDRKSRPKPGARPGIEHMADRDTPPAPQTVVIECIDYGPDRVETTKVDDLDTFLSEPRPAWAAVRWINVDGLHPFVVDHIKEAFGYHTLAAEDVLHVPQRPKVEPYDDHLFFIARMLRLKDDVLQNKQISFFLTENQLVTFQETPGDVWEPIRERIENRTSRIRSGNAGYLAYTLIDAIIDHCFPILERYGDMLEDLEPLVLDQPKPSVLHRIHHTKRHLAMFRRVMWPMREVVDQLQVEDRKQFDQTTRMYLRDVYDHTVQVVDLIETFRELAGGLTDLYMSSVSNRMNEIMKVLTIMASLFIPITFLAGIFGMNFEHMPELKWKYSYAVFWAICISVTTGLLMYFWRKGWIGKS